MMYRMCMCICVFLHTHYRTPTGCELRQWPCEAAGGSSIETGASCSVASWDLVLMATCVICKCDAHASLAVMRGCRPIIGHAKGI